MPKYLLEVKYTLEGVKGLLAQGGTAREAAAQAAAETLGGNVDSFFYAFGEQDLFGIIDMPDNASMAAYALTVTAGGGGRPDGAAAVTGRNSTRPRATGRVPSARLRSRPASARWPAAGGRTVASGLLQQYVCA